MWNCETEQFLGFPSLKDGPNEKEDVVNKHTETETCSSLCYSNIFLSIQQSDGNTSPQHLRKKQV